LIAFLNFFKEIKLGSVPSYIKTEHKIPKIKAVVEERLLYGGGFKLRFDCTDKILMLQH
jgi:hypothetical protein